MNISFEQLIKDMNTKIIPVLGRFPSRQERRKNNFNLGYNLEYVICKFGLNKIIEACNCKIKKRHANYWKNWDNVKNEILKDFSHLIVKGIFPTYQQLVSANITISLISKQFGGLAELADKFNCKLASVYKCRDGHFAQSIYECILDEYMYSRNIEHYIHPSIDGRFYADFKAKEKFIEIWGFRKNDTGKIGERYNKKRNLKKIAYSKINHCPIEFEGDFFDQAFSNFVGLELQLDNFFKSFGFDTIKKQPFNIELINEAGDVWCEKTVEEALRSLIEKIGHFPSIKELKLNNLSSSVSRFGGITHFRKKMGCLTVKDKRSLRTNWTDAVVLQRLKNAINYFGRCPTQQELVKYDVNLLGGIKICGGLEKFKIILGLQQIKPKKYWSDERIIEQLSSMNCFPTKKQLKENNKPLMSAIDKRGGLIKFKNLMNKK